MVVGKFRLRLRTKRAAPRPDRGLLATTEGAEAATAGYRQRKADFELATASSGQQNNSGAETSSTAGFFTRLAEEEERRLRRSSATGGAAVGLDEENKEQPQLFRHARR